MPVLESLTALLLLLPLVVLLERTHRRTSHLPRAPFGADAESEATWAYRHQLAELRQQQTLGLGEIDEGSLNGSKGRMSPRV
jgi:hypothetical protein